MLNNRSKYYRVITGKRALTRAEATIAWFCSGKRQPIIESELRIPVYANYSYNCAPALQSAVDFSRGDHIYVPKGEYYIGEAVVFSVQEELK